MLESGFVRIYRSFLNWEWYTDTNTKVVFLHLILTANWEPKKWRGKVIQRGQRVFSYTKLSKEVNLSLQQTRTAIEHLKSTGEITCSGKPKYSIVTIKNYDAYQQLTNGQHADSVNKLLINEKPEKNQHTKQQATNMAQPQAQSQKQASQKSVSTSAPTNEQHTSNIPPTYEQHQLKKDKESNKDNKEIYAGAFASYANGNHELLEALKDYAVMRKQKKKPLSTERAVKMLFHSLDKMASDDKTKIAILNQSVFSNWTGVFPLKGNTKSQQYSDQDNGCTFDIDKYEKESLNDTKMKD